MILSFDQNLFGLSWALDRALDDDRGRNGLPPMSQVLRRVADAVSAAGALIPRTLFCQHLRPADQALNATPLLRMRYNDSWANGRMLRSRALYLPPFTAAPAPGTASPSITMPLGAAVRVGDVNATQAEPRDLRMLQRQEDQTPVTNAYRNLTMSTANSFRLVAFAVDQVVRGTIGEVDTAWGAAVNSARFRRGNTVIDDALSDLRLIEDVLWRRLRHVWAAWSSVQEVVGQARSVTGTIYTNLITLTTADATWDAQRPGEIVSAENAGLGPQTVASGGDRLAHRCAVYADATVANGEVRFESSLGSVTITIPFGVAPAWIAAGSTLPVATGIEYDNVVIAGRNLNAGGDTRTWRWMIQPEP